MRVRSVFFFMMVPFMCFGMSSDTVTSTQDMPADYSQVMRRKVRLYHIVNNERIHIFEGTSIELEHFLRKNSVWQEMFGLTQISLCPLCGQFLYNQSSVKNHIEKAHKKIDETRFYEISYDKYQVKLLPYEKDKIEQLPAEMSANRECVLAEKMRLLTALGTVICEGTALGIAGFLEKNPAIAALLNLKRRAPCPRCFQFFNKDNIYDHIYAAHVDLYKKNKKYICLQCNIYFRNREELQDHFTRCPERWYKIVALNNGEQESAKRPFEEADCFYAKRVNV